MAAEEMLLQILAQTASHLLCLLPAMTGFVEGQANARVILPKVDNARLLVGGYAVMENELVVCIVIEVKDVS